MENVTVSVELEYFMACGWIRIAREYLRNPGPEPTMGEFSSKIKCLISQPKVSQADRELMQTAILANPRLLHFNILKEYLALFKDDGVAKMYIDRLSGFEPTDEIIAPDDLLVSSIQRVLSVTMIYTPDKVVPMVKLFLAMFPGLPYGENGTSGGIKGYLKTLLSNNGVAKEGPEVKSLQVQQPAASGASVQNAPQKVISVVGPNGPKTYKPGQNTFKSGMFGAKLQLAINSAPLPGQPVPTELVH